MEFNNIFCLAISLAARKISTKRVRVKVGVCFFV